MSKMLMDLGHEVYLYGAEGSNAECSEFIQTHTLKDIRDAWGGGDNRFEIGYDWKNQEFRHDFNETKTGATRKYSANCVKEIKSRFQPGDFVMVTQGFYQKPIADAVGAYLTIEPGIGYRGSYARFRAFESSYLQNFTYGSEHPRQSINGNYYDVVIGNYFDRKDFPIYEEKPRDYYLYLGRLTQRKGLWTAIKTTEILGKKLIIAGQQNSEFNSFDLPSHCEFVGFADKEKRNKLMAEAVATFVPTIYLEAFAGTHIESRLSGTPVLTTNFGVFPGTVKNGVDGFRCDTLDDFVWGAKEVVNLDRRLIRKRAEKYFMDHKKWEFQKWFDDLYQLYLSAQDNKIKGWHHIRKQQPEWRLKLL